MPELVPRWKHRWEGCAVPSARAVALRHHAQARPAASAMRGRITGDGCMEWTFTGEVIEWRGPAPYLFVAMTPQDSEDLKETGGIPCQAGQICSS